MAELFDVDGQVINKHLNNICDKREFIKDSTISKMKLVQKEENRNVKLRFDFYNLSVIISIGYRIN